MPVFATGILEAAEEILVGVSGAYRAFRVVDLPGEQDFPVWTFNTQGVCLSTARSDLSTQALWDLPKRYVFERASGVYGFLESHSFVLPVLEEAPTHINRVFGVVPLKLEVFVDPENGSRSLMLLVGASLAPREVLVRLRELDDAWWLDAMVRAKGKVCLDVGS